MNNFWEQYNLLKLVPGQVKRLNWSISTKKKTKKKTNHRLRYFHREININVNIVNKISIDNAQWQSWISNWNPINIAHHLNVFKSKHQIITGRDAEKAVGKIQQGVGVQPFLIKSLEKTVMCGYLTL